MHGRVLPKNSSACSSLAGWVAWGDSVDEQVRQRFEQLGVRMLQATPQLLGAHLMTQDPWLQQAILQSFLENAVAAFPQLCKALSTSRDADVRVAALSFLKEYQNLEYGVNLDELRKAITNAKRSKNSTVKATANKILESFCSPEDNGKTRRTK